MFYTLFAYSAVCTSSGWWVSLLLLLLLANGTKGNFLAALTNPDQITATRGVGGDKRAFQRTKWNLSYFGAQLYNQSPMHWGGDSAILTKESKTGLRFGIASTRHGKQTYVIRNRHPRFAQVILTCGSCTVFLRLSPDRSITYTVFVEIFDLETSLIA